MAKWVKKEIPTFNHKEDLLGCVAHVINLAAKAALATFGPIDQEEDDEELPTSMMDLQVLTHEPSGIHVDLKIVLKRVHGFSVFV
ncbi:hypothetical protein VP01_2608g4 [Puccinia sorghi]|uniref:Uncharacterized protein n=1 Tax=Puccinia sorghi TaxID=27349 RepID=A0A0L6V566_9BASI|nr:hypothetical protein VP01_2608g4 [Puccinia sorghi]